MAYFLSESEMGQMTEQEQPNENENFEIHDSPIGVNKIDAFRGEIADGKHQELATYMIKALEKPAIHRRTFLRNALHTLSFGTLAPSVLTSALMTACVQSENAAETTTSSIKKISSSSTTTRSVIVIGAGIAGLSAASQLAQQGYAVTVLESQSKVGGRLSTDRSLGIPFDQGASWIHRPNGNPITPLAAQAGATTFLTDDHNVVVHDVNGAAYPDATLTSTEHTYNTVRDSIPGLGSLNQSFAAVFNSNYPQYQNDRLWKYMLSAYLEFDVGGDVSKISSLYFEDDRQFSGDDVIVTNGYDTVANYLAKGLNLILNTQVAIIDYSGDQVTVATTGGQIYQADSVVVTVPLGVLKSNAITFIPALPSEKAAAIANMGMGNINKFLLTWNAPFWDTSLQYIGYTPDSLGQFNYYLNINKYLASANALMTFAFGDYATATEAMTDSEVINAIMANLQTIYGSSIPFPTNMLRTAWGKNVNSFGAYSYAASGTTSADFDTLAEAINNKVFFAGEHTNRDYRGTVHGAYLSGTREVAKIMAL